MNTVISPETEDNSSTGICWKLQKDCRKATVRLQKLPSPTYPLCKTYQKNTDYRKTWIKHKESIGFIFLSASSFHKQPNFAECFVKMNSC